MAESLTDAELACRECIDLFEVWRDGVFADIGVVWTSEPPAVQHARAVVQRAEERIQDASE